MMKWILFTIFFLGNVFLYKIITLSFILFCFTFCFIVFFPYKYYVSNLKQLLYTIGLLSIFFFVLIFGAQKLNQNKTINAPIVLSLYNTFQKSVPMSENGNKKENISFHKKTQKPYSAVLREALLKISPVSYYGAFVNAFYVGLLSHFTKGNYLTLFSYIVALILVIYLFSSNYSMLITYANAFVLWILLTLLYVAINSFTPVIKLSYLGGVPCVLWVINYYKVKLK